MQKRFSSTEPLLLEKIIASLSYITMGTVGFIWLLIAIFTKNNLRPFLKYHVFQSIFISIAYFLASKLFEIIMSVVSIIPFVNKLAMTLMFLLNMPLFGIFSIVQIILYSIMLYLIVTCVQGQLSYLPWISDIIRANVKNS